MRSSPLSFRAALLVTTLGLSAALPAGVLFQNNFDALPAGPFHFASFPGIVAWEGPSSREYGWVEIGGALSSVVVYDNNADLERSPSLQFTWKEKTPETGLIEVEWDFLVPVQGDYKAVFFVGNDWANSIVNLILQNGNIYVRYDKGDATRVHIGGYAPGKWQTIRFVLDPAKKTFDAALDGQNVMDDYAWIRTYQGPFERVIVVADHAAVDRKGEAVLLIDNVSVTSTP